MIKDQQHSNGDVQTSGADSLEFRLLMAYTRKRRPADTRLQQDVPSSPQPTEKHRKPQKNKRKKRLSFLLKCIKPQADEQREQQPATLDTSDDGKIDEVENMVSELTEISDSVHFTSSDIEPDSVDEESDVAKKLAEMLKEHGDELNEKIKADKVLLAMLQSSLTYGFFKKVMEAFCGGVSPDVPPEQKDKKVDVALICEATSQLVGIHYHPMTYVMNLGAQYLQENYSGWISRNMHVGNGEVGDESKEEVQ
ncbi:apoptosis facilitator Bcl-2 14 isoform X1 [Labeo rohita]|uniref:Apoptosis facilitator Bcl-2 14 isoform X1 n=1 Tax=Labeo rohita TaxID=84645 RepID=A0A498MXF8_LABRO|nr:apoptosis facilitator Bcl-2 14 isoform X1 [Labeo rohita]